MDPRSGVKDYVRLSVSLERYPDRSGGIFVVRGMTSYVHANGTGSLFSRALGDTVFHVGEMKGR